MKLIPRILLGLVVLLMGAVLLKQAMVQAQGPRAIVAVPPHQLVLQDVVLDSLRKQYQRSRKLAGFNLDNGKIPAATTDYLQAVYVQNEIIIQQLALLMQKQAQ